MSVSRGVLYIKWGDGADTALKRSLNSLRAFHPEWPVHVAELPSQSTLLDKAGMMELSPFEQTLYLDTNTVVMDRLELGFEKAAKFGLACCICENPWARRHIALGGDTIEYNTGVLFFSRQAKPVFELWAELAPKLDSTTRFKSEEGELCEQPCDDQASFAAAVEESGFCPFALPLNWNLRPRYQPKLLGPVKIWHDYADPPAGLAEYNKKQCGEQKFIATLQLRGF